MVSNAKPDSSDIFTKCCNESESSRLQVYYPVLCEKIYFWYKDYLSIDVDKMGLEITRVINRFIKDENISKIPDNKEGFFKYLATSINKEKASFFRDYDEKDTIKIPREKKQKLREVEDFIRMKESQLGRKLSFDECLQGISKWFKKQEYVDLLNSMNVGSFFCTSNDENNGIDVLNCVDTLSVDPLEKYISKTDMETALMAVQSLLEKKQERSRDCYRALFTLYCIENYKDFESLYPILDGKIIETWQKNMKKPKHYEIYQMYHPNARKSSADAMASKNLAEFLNDVEIFLKEKNQ